MKVWPMAVCGLLVIGGVVLAVTGTGAVALLPAAGCVLMMGVMAWMVVRAARRGDGEPR
jgi:hypothetical protein